MKECNNCKHKDCWEYADPCNSCTDVNDTREPTNWEAQTNADRIRAMTDEELAEWIASDVLNLAGGALAMATEAWLDWLKQEAKE